MRTVLSKTCDNRNGIVNDDRGRKDPANKKSQEMAEKVVSHIKKYNPSISHYRWAHAPNRLYISAEHSVSSMHKDFIACYLDDQVSYNYYQNKVKDLNISSVKLGEEEFVNCIYPIWKRSIMLPRLTCLKKSIFCKRLVLFNETFSPIWKSEMKPVGVLWHEAINGRSAEDVASTFSFFIRNFWDCEKFVFWTDNCSGQNKNCFLYMLLVNEANRINGTMNEIIIKYFEPGHTFIWRIVSTIKLNKAWRKKSELKIL